MKELGPPPLTAADPKSTEMVRAWVAHGGLHCSLNVGVFGKDELIGWGILLSDIARHVADALAQSENRDKEQSLAAMQKVFNDELKRPTATTKGSFQ